MKKVLLIPMRCDIETFLGITNEIIFYLPDPHRLNEGLIYPFEYTNTCIDPSATNEQREQILIEQIIDANNSCINIITPEINFEKLQQLIVNELGAVMYDVECINQPLEKIDYFEDIYIAEIPVGKNFYSMITVASFMQNLMYCRKKLSEIFNGIDMSKCN